MKIFLRFFLFIVLVGIPFFAIAEVEGLYPDGTLIQTNVSSQKYFIFQGEAWRIANAFTLKQLGLDGQDSLVINKKGFEKIPKGEVLKISLPKVRGIFDMHEHFRDGGKMDLYLQIAKRLGVEKTVFVPTGNAPDNRGYKEHMKALLKEQKKHPNRVIAFCTIDEADIEAPKIFEDCLDKGGKGLKLLGGHPDLYDAPLDSETMKEVFRIANERDVPVITHVSLVTLPKAKEEFKRLMDQFPNTAVQFAHYCSTIYNGINLDQCAEFLDRYPNMIIDLSMGGGIQRYFKYMTEDMKPIKDFVLKYQDRIVYGTDMILSSSGPTVNKNFVRGRMMCDFSLLQEKWYRCPAVNKDKYVLLPGFNFPKEILQKIFVVNPKRFLKLNELAYPFDSLCSKKDHYFQCGSQLAEFSCDYVSKPSESLKDLNPQYPTIVCSKVEYLGEETSRGVTRDLVLREFIGEVVVSVTDYVIFKNGTFELISSADDFKKTFAPIESSDEALAYIQAFHKGSFIFDLAPFSKLKGGTFKVPKSDIKITSVEESETGFTINVYSTLLGRNYESNDCINEIYEQVLFVSRTGDITEQEPRLIWESKEKPRCIS